MCYNNVCINIRANELAKHLDHISRTGGSKKYGLMMVVKSSSLILTKLDKFDRHCIMQYSGGK